MRKFLAVSLVVGAALTAPVAHADTTFRLAPHLGFAWICEGDATLRIWTKNGLELHPDGSAETGGAYWSRGLRTDGTPRRARAFVATPSGGFSEVHNVGRRDLLVSQTCR